MCLIGSNFACDVSVAEAASGTVLTWNTDVMGGKYSGSGNCKAPSKLSIFGLGMAKNEKLISDFFFNFLYSNIKILILKFGILPAGGSRFFFLLFSNLKV